MRYLQENTCSYPITAGELAEVTLLKKSKLRVCLHGGGRPQVGEVTRLGGVTRLSI